MNRDPEGTVKKAGISLNSEEWATVRNIVMSTNDETLRARVSKGQVKQ